MAKNRENQTEPIAEAQQQPQQPSASASPVVTDAIAAAGELFVARSEIERLRAENQILKSKQLAAVGLSAEKGEKENLPRAIRWNADLQ